MSSVEARIRSSAPAFVTRRTRGGVTFGRDWQEIDLAELGLEATQAILDDPHIEKREVEGPSGADPPPPKAKRAGKKKK